MRRFLTFAAVLIACLGYTSSSASAAPSRAFTGSLGTGDFSGPSPQALAVDQSSGDVYALSVGNKVYRYTASGAPANFTAGPDAGTNTLTGFLFDAGPGAAQVAVDNSGGPADGNIYVTSSFAGTVKVFASDGSLRGSLNGSGTPAGGYGEPCGVAVDQATGDVYVGDYGTPGRVWRYSPGSATPAESDYSGAINPGFSPCQLAVADGHLYAVNFDTGSANSFLTSAFATGAPPAVSGTQIAPAATAVATDPDSGELYVNDGHEITVFHPTGAPFYTFGSSAEFGTTSSGVAVKAGGAAYVADRHPGGNEVDTYGAVQTPSRAFSGSFGTGDFSGPSPQALAVDQSSGDVYALSVGNKVYRYTASGAPANFTAGANAGTNALTGFAFDSGPGAAQVAVDNSGGPANGNVYVTSSFAGTVKVFASDGSLRGSLNGSGTPAGGYGEPCGVAVDQSTGDVYVGDYGTPGRVWRYSPGSATPAESDYSGGINPGFSPCQLAVADGHVYAINFDTGAASSFSTSAFTIGTPPTVSGTQVAPTATALATDPESGNLYVDKGNQIAVFYPTGVPFYTFGSAAEFGTTSSGVAVKAGGAAYVADRHSGGNQVDTYGTEAYGQTLTVTKEGPGSGVVTSAPAGIDCGSSCTGIFDTGTSVTLTAVFDPGSALKVWSGCDSVTTAGCTITLNGPRTVTATFSSEPVISAVRATEISTTSAKLGGTVDPKEDATTYHFDYGTDTTYGSATPESSPISGATATPVVRQIHDLRPDTTYHYRLVATNATGTNEGPDATFTTYSTARPASLCPNDTYRIGAGARLSDCRAYEQASPSDKNGNNTQSSPNSVQAARDGDAITFVSLGGVPGGTGAQQLPTFLATRGAGAWATQGLLPPANLGYKAEVTGWLPSLGIAFDTAAEAGATSYLARDNASGSLKTVVPASAGGSLFVFVGASRDGSKVFFEAAGPVLPGVAADKDNLYLFDRDTGAVSLAGALPDAACTTPPCAPSGGAFSGPFDYWSNGITATTLARGGAALRYYTQDMHTVSTSGDRAFFTAGGTGELYVRKGLTTGRPETSQVNASTKTNGGGPGGTDTAGPAPAVFRQATPDGRFAFFTSSEELTNDAVTGPEIPSPYIGRADLDGTHSDTSFVTPQGAQAVAVDGTHVYWADAQGDAIGRANLDGSDPEPAFITGADNPQGVAVDAGHVYWTNGGDSAVSIGTIGRANLDGTGVDQAFIADAGTHPLGIDVNAHHIYWSTLHVDYDRVLGGTVAWANLDGSDVDLEINGAGGGDVVVNGSHLYVSQLDGTGGQSIYRLNLDGSNDPTWTSKDNVYYGGLVIDGRNPCTRNPARVNAGDCYGPGLALDGSHLYWANAANNEVGRSGLDRDLDGTNQQQAFLATDGAPRGLAVDGAHLFWSTAAALGVVNQGNDLYRYDVESGALLDLAPDSAATNGADVRGMLGASDDGSFVYFVANADLDGAGPARSGDCAGTNDSGEGQCSLYLWHDGAISFIARLDTSGEVNDDAASSDIANWAARTKTGGGFRMTTSSRIGAGGQVLLFRSKRRLTAYDNHGVSEFYRYRYAPGGGTIDCVSCNPTGDAPVGAPGLQSQTSALSLGAAAAITPRNLSADGNRIFFESPDALVAADTNGAGGCPNTVLGRAPLRVCTDVYQWEAQGSGSCRSAAVNGGCLSLLSSGTDSRPSTFADASVSGDDAFFFTAQPLVGSDRDHLIDLYDARVGGGLAAQHPDSPAAPCSGETCRPAPASPPGALATAGSLHFWGPGPLAAVAEPKPTTRKVSVKRPKTVRGSTKVRLSVKAPAKGRIWVSGSGLRRAKKTVKKAKTYRVTVKLSKRSKRILRRKHRVKVRATVRFTPQHGKRSQMRVRVTFKTKKHHHAHRRSSSRVHRRAAVLSPDARKGR